MTSVNEPSNKNTKAIWIGLGAAALFCLCAVAVAFFVFYKAGQRVKEGMKTDPASASKAAHEIADYDLPPGYQEQMSMDLMVYKFAIIAPPTTNNSIRGPMIMLAQFNAIGTDPQQMEQQLRKSLEQQSGNRGTNMKVVDVKKMTIRGSEASVVTYEGSSANGNTLRQVITSFPGKNGTAMLIIMGSAQTWDQQMVDDFIKSIR